MANALADFLGGYQAGNEITQQQRQQRQQNQLSQLAPQIVSGDPQAYAQAAAINPQAAQQYQAGGDEIARRARGAAKFLQSALQSGNQQQIMAARQTIKPFMDTLKPGSSYPLDLDPQQEMAGIQGFLAQTSYLDPTMNGQGQVQSTYVDAQGNRVAIMRNGSTQILGQDNPKMQIIDTGDGFYGVNKGTLQAAPVSTRGASTTAAMPTEADMNADAQIANEMIAAGIPEAQVDAFLTARGQRASSMQQPAADSQLRKAPAAITPYQQAQLGMDSQRLDIQRQSAEDARAAREEAASTRRMMNEQKARQAQQAIDTRQAALNNINRGIERVRNALKAVDSTVTGSGPIAQYGTRYREAGQELESAVGAMQNSMLALTRVPGVGSQSDLEARIANLIYPSLDRNSQVNQNTLKNLEQFARDLGGTARQADEEDRKAAQQPAAAPPSTQSGGVDDLLSKYGVR